MFDEPPVEFKTYPNYKLLEYADYYEGISNGLLNIDSVPEIFKDYNMYKSFMSATSPIFRTLNSIPVQFRDNDLCLLSVAKCGVELKLVPDDIIDTNMCKVAISNDFRSVMYVPEKRKTFELLIFAMEHGADSIVWNGILNQSQREYISLKYGN